jgi:hypothetical protein
MRESTSRNTRASTVTRRRSRQAEGGGAEPSMMQTIQLAIADGMYAASLREALSRSCAWHIESVGRPDPTQHCVMVLDPSTLEQLPLPLSNPERIVLISHRDSQLMAEAWEAGIVSVVSEQDPISTVLLAIMAAGLRVDKPHGSPSPSGISPTAGTAHASLPPEHRNPGSKRLKTQ